MKYIDEKVENYFTKYGLNCDEEYMTYMELLAWLWDNTSYKLSPMEEVTGGVCIYHMNEDGCMEQMTGSFDCIEDAVESAVGYIVDNELKVA